MKGNAKDLAPVKLDYDLQVVDLGGGRFQVSQFGRTPKTFRATGRSDAVSQFVNFDHKAGMK